MSPLPRPRPLRRRASDEPDRTAHPGNLMRRWRDFQERQVAGLRESNRLRGHADPAPDTGESAGADHADDQDQDDGGAFSAGPGFKDHGTNPPGDGSVPGERTSYGLLGKPLSRTSPLYIGFVGAIGVALAYLLVHVLSQLTTTLTVLLVAFFLTLALNPIVESLVRRGMARPLAVATVCIGLVLVFTALTWVVVPPLVSEMTDLGNNAPTYVQHFLDQPWVQKMDRDYQVSDKIQSEVQKRVTDGTFVSQVFGGVLGAGMAVAAGVFQALTILILTLYFLVSLPRVKQSAYAIVPATRRQRVMSLSEEIMRRTGSYAVGQVAVASVNAVCSWIMMTVLGIPYAAVLAVVVGFLGLIPMVGATLGAVIVALVAFFVEPQKAIIVAIYYLVYQQVENYVVVPKIMQRTVSVPGAVTVVAALAGGTLLGVLGALLAIPVAAGLLLLYEEVLVPRQSQH